MAQPGRRYLAIDLGAESGRALVGCLAGERLQLEEIHRFPNQPVEVLGTLYWDGLSLFREILTALAKAAQAYGTSIESVGVDTWGVDFGLLDRDGALLANPVHYRDRRTQGMPERVAQVIPPDELYEVAGLREAPINTLYQLLALRLGGRGLLNQAQTLLMMPSLFLYFLTGTRANEYTDAATTQLLDLRSGSWAETLFERLELPLSIMGPIARPGASLGRLAAQVASSVGLPSTRVIAPATHDTASALAAAPAECGVWAFASCGTWSVVGMPVAAPVTTPAARVVGLSNIAGVGETFLGRNITGLWLLQQLRREWESTGDHWPYERLLSEGEQAPPFTALVNPDDASFHAPPRMSDAVIAFCERTRQVPPPTRGAMIRALLESLALSHAHALYQIMEITRQRARIVHIVGGGSINRLLCQFTANACGLPVAAGPAEATAAGNVLVQALGAEAEAKRQWIRDVVRGSFEPLRYEPEASEEWAPRLRQFAELVA